MTEDEVDSEVGRALRDYSENERRIACLQRRLGTFSNALGNFVGNPLHEESWETIKKASADPRSDVAALRECLAEHARFREFFRKHGLTVP